MLCNFKARAASNRAPQAAWTATQCSFAYPIKHFWINAQSGHPPEPEHVPAQNDGARLLSCKAVSEQSSCLIRGPAVSTTIRCGKVRCRALRTKTDSAHEFIGDSNGRG